MIERTFELLRPSKKGAEAGHRAESDNQRDHQQEPEDKDVPKWPNMPEGGLLAPSFNRWFIGA